jgi:lipoprotein-anchoring transpeptidase ErfK/SrfK
MEVLMSRTSRRVSRPLIAALTIVIVLGVVFTIHKLHNARATVTPAPMSRAAEPAPSAPGTPKVASPTPNPAPVAVSETTQARLIPVAVDPSALVTQTPTEKVPSDPAPEPQTPTHPNPVPSTPIPSPTPATASADTGDSDSGSLEQWAKGNKPASGQNTLVASAAPTSPALASTATPAVHTTVSAQPLVDAKTKVDAGDLIAARQILNDALIAAHGESDSLKKQIEEINQTLIFSPRKFPDDPWGGNYQVASGERLGTIAARNNTTWELVSRINGITPKRLRSGQTIKLVKGPFYAIVYKHLFKMDLYLGAPGGDGSMYVRTFQVGLGKDNSTPTGLWMCRSGDKIRNPRYYPPHGGEVIAPDDPKNPLGGYWIAIEGLEGQALGKESFGIHGTIDPDSIGKMESMGCIRLRSDDISWVFDMFVDGKSKVLVKD